MNGNAPVETGPASFLPEKLKKKLHYWFIQYNPLYFFSALCILFGVFLISKGLPELDWQRGQFLLTAVMQFYEILLIAGSALLIRIAGQYRPAVILTLIEIFFLFDSTFRTEIIATFGRFGIMLSGGWVVMVAIKLAALVWVFRLKVPFVALILPVLAAAGIAGMPHFLWLQNTDKSLIHSGAVWYGIILFAALLYRRPNLSSVLKLDDWGLTVLRRVGKTALIMWSGFYFFHLFMWIEMFEIPLLTAQIAPFFLLWLLAKKDFWSWAGGLLTIVMTLSIPHAVSPAALLVGIAFGLKAWRLRRNLFYPAAVLSLYSSVWTLGWQGKGWPDTILWLNIVTALLFLFMAWRLRLVTAIPAALLVLLPSGGSLIPRGLLQWGIFSTVTGFLSLIAGIIVNLYMKKPLPVQKEKPWTAAQARLLSEHIDGPPEEDLSTVDAAIIGLWHRIMADKRSAFHCYPAISAAKLRNAMMYYASLRLEERVIALFDSTIFGSGKYGCLITTRGIYHRSRDKYQAGYVSYGDMNPSEIEGKKIFSTPAVHIRKDIDIQMNGIDEKESLPKLVLFIKKSAIFFRNGQDDG